MSTRVRFAPSPTGHLHLGGARSAIFNWLFAKANQGLFLLRIEDTDFARSTEEYKKSILESLAWLGINSDEPVVIQSENSAKHKVACLDLVKKGLAYPCFCSSKDLEAAREEFGQGFKYPGTCRNLGMIELEQAVQNNTLFSVRIKLQNLPETLTFQDLIKGAISVSADALDDFVIFKSDGIATYNFAVVLDDIEMNITHVLRGEEHIINTFKQEIIYNLLQKTPPLFGHLPMILGKSGEKLSKRDGATAVLDYKNTGYLPHALFNYLVKLGWSYKNQEIFTKDELIQVFSLSGIGVKNAIFDVEKLNWINSHYIKQQSYEDFFAYISEFKSNESLVLSESKSLAFQLHHIYKNRSDSVTDLLNKILEIIDLWKSNKNISFLNDLADKERVLVTQFLGEIKELKNLSNSLNVADYAKSFMTNNNLKVPELSKPLRYYLTGKQDGPSAIELAEVFLNHFSH